MRYVIIFSLFLVGCASDREDIDAALKVCEKNGGLKEYNINHSAECENGAFFQYPTISLEEK